MSQYSEDFIDTLPSCPRCQDNLEVIPLTRHESRVQGVRYGQGFKCQRRQCRNYPFYPATQETMPFCPTCGLSDLVKVVQAAYSKFSNQQYLSSYSCGRCGGHSFLPLWQGREEKRATSTLISAFSTGRRAFGAL